MISSSSMTGTGVSLEASHRYCADLTRAEARNFFYAFWFLPAHKRRGIYSIYAFSRRLDDIADGLESARDATHHEPAGLTSIERLRYMRSLLDPETPTDDTLAPALRDTVTRFGIALEHFDELVEGMIMDLEGHTYRTFEDLRLYCYRAASTVGLICIEIFGYDDRAPRDEIVAPAVDLGLAMQLTNILRDIKEDLGRGRVYLPDDELARFGVTRESLEQGIVDDRFRSLMRFQVERARDYFRRAEPLFPLLDPSSRYSPIMLKRLYSALLDQIERAGYDVFRRRPALSSIHKLRLAGSLGLRAMLASVCRGNARNHHSSR